MVGVGRCYFILIVGKYNSNHFSSGQKGVLESCKFIVICVVGE